MAACLIALAVLALADTVISQDRSLLSGLPCKKPGTRIVIPEDVLMLCNSSGSHVVAKRLCSEAIDKKCVMVKGVSEEYEEEGEEGQNNFQEWLDYVDFDVEANLGMGLITEEDPLILTDLCEPGVTTTIPRGPWSCTCLDDSRWHCETLEHSVTDLTNFPLLQQDKSDAAATPSALQRRRKSDLTPFWVCSEGSKSYNAHATLEYCDHTGRFKKMPNCDLDPADLSDASNSRHVSHSLECQPGLYKVAKECLSCPEPLLRRSDCVPTTCP